MPTNAGANRGGWSGTPRSVSLDDLIALNDEVAALARAGLPIELGLSGLADSTGGPLGDLTRRLRDRLASGESLAEAFRAEGKMLPPSYRALVEAGMRSGRLSEALEGLANSARNVSELRRAIGLAFLYPLIVLMLAYGLFVGFVLRILPTLVRGFDSTRSPVPEAESLLASMDRWWPFWVPVVPVSVALFVTSWWVSRRARSLSAGAGLDRVPWLRGVLADCRASGFAGMLAMLVEHEVPLPEALPIAAEAVGGRRLEEQARRRAEAIGRGEVGVEADPGPFRRGTHGFPPLLRWVLSGGADGPRLAPALRAVEVTYRRRALRRAEMIRVILPSLLLVAIGGVAAVLLAATLFVPWTALIEVLARPRS